MKNNLKIDEKPKINNNILDSIKKNKLNDEVSYITYILYAFIIILSIYTYPSDWNSNITSIQHVWYYGWITGL